MYVERFTATFLSLSAALLLVPSAHGQLLKGTILGTVTDTTQAVMPNVAVELTDVNTNYKRTTVTNESGFFAFANLDPDNYSIDVRQTGFKETRREGIVLNANTTVRADFALEPGTQTQVVDVTSEAPVLQTDRADTGGQLRASRSTIFRCSTSGIIRTRWWCFQERRWATVPIRRSSIPRSLCRFQWADWTG